MDEIIRFAADGLLVLILAVAAVFGVYYIVWKQHLVTRVAPVAVMAGLTALLVAKLISLLYQPSSVRPYIEQGVSAGASYIDNPGFPSDHALLAAVVVIMLFMVTPYKKVAIVLAVAATLMSAARVAALVHAPIDILGGVLAATLGALWYTKLHVRMPKN